MKSKKTIIQSEIAVKEALIDNLVFDIYKVDKNLREKIEFECNAF